MFPRPLIQKLSRNRPFCLFGARSVGKTTLLRDFAGKFSNLIYLDLETAVDRAIFNLDVSAEETLKAISFLKGKEIRGSGTLIVLDELYKCSEAIRWVSRLYDESTSGQVSNHTVPQGEWKSGDRQKGPLVVATSSVMTKELMVLTNPENGIMQPYFLYPFSFEEFLPMMEDSAALEAFREVPVPYYAYEKLLNYFHLYALIGGMPEIILKYAESKHLSGLKNLYKTIEDRFIQGLQDVTAGSKSWELAVEVLQNTYPYAATRIRFNRFGNLEKGSREIAKAFHALERSFILQMVAPVTSVVLPLIPDRSKFPQLHFLDTGLVNFFSGIQKPLFQSHDMNAIFEGQIARQVVGQEILVAVNQEDWKEAIHVATVVDVSQELKFRSNTLNFWVRDKPQSTSEVDFVIPYDELLIPVVVRSGEPGRLRSLHQFIDMAPHAFAVRLYAGKLTVQQTQTIRGKKFYLLNLPYFLAGKIKDHLKGFIRLTNG
jgi:predicted AAA+ superfamily ATPase